MKKLMKSLMLFAAAAMALTSCENEGINEGIEANDTYTLTFTAGAPESKTSVDITTGKYAWGDDEVVTFLQYANESARKVTSSDYQKGANGTATFGATFNTIDGATTYNHIAIYPSTNYVGSVNDDFADDKIRVMVPQNQTLTADNFDPKADLMISKIITTEGAASEALSMEFSRLAAVGVMNLKGVKNGEKISKVTFTIGDANTKLTGRHTFKFSDGSLCENAYYGFNSVILSATEGNELTAVEAGTPIYFTCLDGKFFGAYSVEVETDLATYTTAADKTLAEEKALVFSAGDVLKFTLNATERVEKDFSIDHSGDYQILTKRSSGNYFYATSDLGTASTKRYQAVDAGSEDINSVSTTNENTVWTIEKVADSDKYYVKAGEQYACWATGNSANFTGDIDSAIKFTIDANDDGTYNIHWTASDAERYFALNGNSGSDYFAFYKSGQKQDLQLIPYVVETKTLQSIAVSGQTTEYEVGDTFNFDGTVTATYTGDTTGKTYTKTITEGYTVSTPDLSQAAESVEVTVTYEGKTATYTITVNAKQEGGEEQTYIVNDFLDELNLSSTTTLVEGTEYPIGDDIIMTVAKGDSSNIPAVNQDNTLRLYHKASADGGSMTLTSEETITKVVFTFTTGYEQITKASVGKYDTDTYTWIGSANSVTFTNGGGTKQARIKTMTITYGGGSSEGGDVVTPEPEDPDTGDDNTGTGGEGEAKTYTFTITKADFNTTSYSANNNSKTSTATASDGSTMDVSWTSNQVMQQSSTMQWQKSNGYIYNTTDLGTITDISVSSTAGTFTTVIGSSQQPTSDGTGGYFKISVGSVTGKVESITVTFTK